MDQHDTKHEHEHEHDEPPHVKAHKASFRNRKSIEQSTTCGCFYCLETFGPEEITEWWDAPKDAPNAPDSEGETAVCPRCGIDSVIGSASGYPITTEFLQQMQRHWF